MHNKNKELATDRLLEVLRGKEVEPEEEETSLHLSEEEERAILSPGNVEKSKVKEKIKFKLAFIFILFVLGIFSIMIFINKSDFEKRLSQINLYSGSVYPILKDYDRLKNQKSALENEKDYFMSQITGITETADVVGVMKILSNITPEYITINDVNISPNNVIITGYVNNTDFNSGMFLADFMVRLENTAFFSRVKPYKEISPEGSSEKLHFEITCII